MRPNRWMPALASIVASWALATALGRPAFADLDLAVGNGAHVQGRISPSDERETFRVTIPQGALLAVTLKGGKGRTGAPARFDLTGPNGQALAAQQIAVAGTGAKLKSFLIATTGEHRIVVHGDGARDVEYDVTIAWKSPAKFVLPADLPSGGLVVPMALNSGATLTLSVKPAKGSGAVPQFVSLDSTTGGPSVPISPPATGSKIHKATVVVPRTDRYALTVSAIGGVAGKVAGLVTVKAPKPSKALLSLRSTSLDGLSSQLAQTAIGPLGPLGGSLGIFSTDSVLSGASVSVPAGALGAPTTIFIASAAPVPAAQSGTSAAGPSVFFGPEGRTFKTPVHVTIPFDTSKFAGVFTSLTVVVRDAKGAVAVVPGPYTIDAARGTVTFATSHFSSYRAFGVTAPSASDLDGDGFDEAVYSTAIRGEGHLFVRFGNAQRDFSIGRFVELVGQSTGDRFGYSFATGDVNGDGTADLVVGAPLANSTGTVYVFFGAANFDTKTSADAELTTTAPQGNFGTSVAVSDVTGDGIAEVVVGDPLALTANGSSGAVYVFHGVTSFTSAATGDPDVAELTGENADDRMGAAVASGDVNADGVRDVVCSAPREGQGGAGRVYVVAGDANLTTLPSLPTPVTITALEDGDAFGATLAVGDVSGDGNDDICAGAPRHAENGQVDQGAVYVFFGGSPLAMTDTSAADRVLVFGAAGDQLGRSLLVGNVTGDHTLDVLIGAPFGDGGFTDQGDASIWRGGPDLGAKRVGTLGGFEDDHWGIFLSVIDYDGDALGDMVIADPGGGGPGVSRGGVALYFGPNLFLGAPVQVGQPDDHLGNEPSPDGLAH